MLIANSSNAAPIECVSLENFLKSSAQGQYIEGILCTEITPQNLTVALGANAEYFGHPKWAKLYFDACHRDQAFINCWRQAVGNWDGKVVIDIGCGPGNVFASLRGQPQRLIGIDVSFAGLKMAAELGYEPLLADAQALPLRSAIADVVIMNATLHHCDNMAAALSEAARLVKPGGILVCDHDPQKSAWNFQGLAGWLWELRLPLYRALKRGGHASRLEQQCALASEAHHHPGDGLTEAFYYQILEPLGFTVQVYPHNHELGAEIFMGQLGRSSLKYRLAQRLSGLDPNSRAAALSLMCIARRQ
ncbi:MAG: class I SAM-dependent methyltransferase [Cyanobacteria bacterium P01_H01_bin.153]